MNFYNGTGTAQAGITAVGSHSIDRYLFRQVKQTLWPPKSHATSSIACETNIYPLVN